MKACHSYREANYCAEVLADNVRRDCDSALIFYELCLSQGSYSSRFQNFSFPWPGGTC